MLYRGNICNVNEDSLLQPQNSNIANVHRAAILQKVILPQYSIWQYGCIVPHIFYPLSQYMIYLQKCNQTLVDMDAIWHFVTLLQCQIFIHCSYIAFWHIAATLHFRTLQQCCIFKYCSNIAFVYIAAMLHFDTLQHCYTLSHFSNIANFHRAVILQIVILSQYGFCGKIRYVLDLAGHITNMLPIPNMPK